MAKRIGDLICFGSHFGRIEGQFGIITDGSFKKTKLSLEILAEDLTTHHNVPEELVVLMKKSAIGQRIGPIE